MMQNHLNKIVKGFFTPHRRQGTSDFTRAAQVEWRGMCLIFLVVLLGVLFWSVTFHKRIVRGEFVPLAPAKSANERGFDRQALQKTLEFFEGKRARYEELREKSFELAGPGPVPQKKE